MDEDVAILPDEDLLFKVKPKLDPMSILCTTGTNSTNSRFFVVRIVDFFVFG